VVAVTALSHLTNAALIVKCKKTVLFLVYINENISLLESHGNDGIEAKAFADDIKAYPIAYLHGYIALSSHLHV